MNTVGSGRLADRTVLVTGAGQGLGAAIAARLAGEGACVMLHYRASESGARALCDKILREGGRAAIGAADLRSAPDCRALLAATETALGRAPDCLVLNAGISKGSPLLAADLPAIADTLNTNLFAAMQLTALALPGMLKHRVGRVVALGSVAGMIGGLNGQCAYAASKAGLAGFIKTLANEMSPRMDFTANLVSPGVVPTELTRRVMQGFEPTLLAHIPAGRFGNGEDVAAAVAFLLAPEAAYINGHELPVDGGYSLHYISRKAAHR